VKNVSKRKGIFVEAAKVAANYIRSRNTSR